MSRLATGSARRRSRAALTTLIFGWLLTAMAAHATKMEQHNLVQLIQQSDRIVIGSVTELKDGVLDNGLPYTEVTLKVAESLRGTADQTYTFRQFGLLRPRTDANGRTNLMVTPDGWAHYSKGESTLLFLYKPAKLTGLQTTAGLAQGKFNAMNGGFVSASNNAGLFDGVKISSTLLTPAQRTMMSKQSGVAKSKPLVDLVRRAVKNKWVETGRMRNEKQ